MEVCTLLLPSNNSIPPWGHVILDSGVGHSNVQDDPQRGTYSETSPIWTPLGPK